MLNQNHYGYLSKYSKKSNNWKKRLFLIRGSIIGYYDNNQNIDIISESDPTGELLLFSETNVVSCSFEGMSYTISLSEPFLPLILACDSDEDRQIWLKYLNNSIEIAKSSLRSFAYRRNESQGIAKKKFFILHSSCITYHKNPDDLSVVQGFIHLDKFTSLYFNDNYLLFNIVDNKTKKTMSMQFKIGEHADQDIYNQWKNTLISFLLKVGGEIKNLDKLNSHRGNFIVKEGPILVKNDKNDSAEDASDWPKFTLRLTDTQLLVIDSLDKDDLTAQVTEIQITPNCSVFETNLGTYSFEIVSSKRVMHLMAESSTVTNEWVDAIRAVIQNSYLDTTDPIFQQALFRIDDDYFYEIEFPVKKPLGLVFERSNDWAIVKHSPCIDQTGVRPGYVLSAINGESVLLEPYQTVIDQLRNWQPPLILGFRVPPEKKGFLLKESKSRRNPLKSVWKKRFFSLSSGALTYKETAESERVVTFPLMGSAVSLLTPQEVGKFFCFKIISGIGSIVMQSSSEKSMMDWASTLYHSIAMANGGAHILQYEKDRVNASLRNEASHSILLNNLQGSRDSWIGQNTRPISEPLVSIMRKASVNNTAELEQAILEASHQNINVSGAVKLLEEIQINKTSFDELQTNLLEAIDKRSIPDLEKLISVCEEIGIIDCENARLILDELKGEIIEKELIDCCQGLTSLDWTLEQETRILSAIDLAKSIRLVDSSQLINAQMKLIQIRRIREDIERTRHTLRSAIQTENIPRIEAALKDALDSGFSQGDNDIVHAKKIIESAQISKARTLLEAAMVSADINNYEGLQQAIAEINGSNISSFLGSDIYKEARSRLESLQALKPIKMKIFIDIADAIENKMIDKLEIALESASKLQLSSSGVTEGHISLTKLRAEAEAAAYWASVAEQKKVAEAEKAETKRKKDIAERALDEAVSKSDWESIDIAIDTISAAIDNAKINEVSQTKIIDGSNYLEKLQKQRQQNDDEKKLKEEQIINEINQAVVLHDAELIQKALQNSYAISQPDLQLEQHPIVLDGFSALRTLRMDELQSVIDVNRKSIDLNNLKHVVLKSQWLEDLIIKRSNVSDQPFIDKLREAKEQLRSIEALIQRKTLSEVALENALREAPLSIPNIEHALNLARSSEVNNELIKHASDMLTGLIIADAERKVGAAMNCVNITNMDPLLNAIKSAKERNVDSYKLNEAILLISKIEKFIETLNQAIESEDTDAIEGALMIASQLNLEGGRIAEASQLLKERRKDDVSERLAFALSEANVDDFEMLIDAIKDAKLCDIYIAELNNAQTVLDALISQKKFITEVIQTLSDAIAKQDITELRFGLTNADRIGYKGEIYDGAKSLLSILLEADAIKKLDEAMSIDYKVVLNFDQLSIAISNAEKLGVRIEKINDAKNLLNTMIKNAEEKPYVFQLLKAAMAAKSIENLHIALDQAENIPDFDEDLLDEAIELLNSLEKELWCEKILVLLNDAIRVKSIKSLTKAVSHAEAAAMIDPLVMQAKELIAELEKEKNNVSTVSTNDEEDEDDLLNDTQDIEVSSTPRKLARRKSKKYSFNSKDAATAEDLYKVFYNHGIKAGTDRHSGFLNPMQFSNIWRLITNEKGNLFREMQMFKKFDINGVGALSSEDFVLGFINLAREQKNDDLLKRIKSIASDDNLLVDTE